MAITRRQFIKRSGLITAGGLLGPAFMRNPFLHKALADAMGDKYLVIIFADGGNDGLNTVVPVDDGIGNFRQRYQTAREVGGLQLSMANLAATTIDDDPNTTTPLALHPGLIGLKTLSNAGKLAVIQGCGYPAPNLSHDESRRRWETGTKAGTGNTGWMGRYLMAAGYGSPDIPSVTIGSSVAKEFVQTTTNVLAMSRLTNFNFPYDNYSLNGTQYGTLDKPFKSTCYAALCAEALANGEPTLQYVGSVGNSTLSASLSYPPLDGIYETDRPTWDAGYSALNTSTANDLREVAKVIYGVENSLDPLGVGAPTARFFQIRNGGYDTHSNQGGASGSHYNLHREVGDAVLQFYNDLNAMPAQGGGTVAQKALIVFWSEFSRRIDQNDSGTDHGSQGPMFVVGGSVIGGTYGNHPNINSLNSQGNTIYSQDPTNIHRSTDFRDVFGTILRHWLDLADPEDVFPRDTGSVNTNWTNPYFDLGFLA